MSARRGNRKRRGGMTRVELEHRDWQKLGGEAGSVRGSYGEGGKGVLRKCVEAC